MALLSKDGKEYIKLNLSECYIDIHGIHVVVNIYGGENIRILEKERDNKLKEFSAKVYSDFGRIEKELSAEADKVEELKNEGKDFEEIKKLLPNEFVDKIDYFNDLVRDMEYITTFSFSIYKPGEEYTIKHPEYFKKFGFEQSWINSMGIIPQMREYITSRSTIGRAITYTDMYKELRKIYKKEDYQDC